jgi:NAD+ kinase
MQIIGIISKPQQESICSVVPELLRWLKQHGIEALCDQETANCIGPQCPVQTREELAGRADMLLVLGGDGTLLAVARAAGDRQVPILPVNLGSLGFLTSVKLEELYAVLDEVLEGRHRVSERIQLQTEVAREGRILQTHHALNDAVLSKATLARIIEMDLTVESGYVCSYRADGLIIATPTGSTAYSLSAGGPIVYPTVDAFVITPICPHSLTNRPLVIPDSMTMDLSFRSGDNAAILTLDGQVGVELAGGDHVVIRKAAQRLKLVRPLRKTYFEILRNKLKWGTR